MNVKVVSKLAASLFLLAGHSFVSAHHGNGWQGWWQGEQEGPMGPGGPHGCQGGGYGCNGGHGCQRGGYGCNGDGKTIAGNYYALYSALVPKTGEIEKREKYMSIKATNETKYFMFHHCWRVDGGDWNKEKGSVIVTSDGWRMIEFTIPELHDDSSGEDVTTGFYTGHTSRRFMRHGPKRWGKQLKMVFVGVGTGVVFEMYPEQIDAELDEYACPKNLDAVEFGNQTAIERCPNC